MKAVVVYESHWGNTEAIARAIADGIGPDAVALTTDAATDEKIAEAGLLVAGAPVIGFRLATDDARASLARAEAGGPRPADVSHPSLQSWLDALPSAHGWSAAFETRIWWSPRGAVGDIERRLHRSGYRRVAPAEKFVVADTYGPLRDGEIDRARAWGRTLAAAVTAATIAA
jgi:hypothetical protein